jgi:hypothetical protein
MTGPRVFALIDVGAARGIWCGRCQNVSFDPSDLDARWCSYCDCYLDVEVRSSA